MIPYLTVIALVLLIASNGVTWIKTKQNTTVLVTAQWKEREAKILEDQRAEIERVTGMAREAERFHAREANKVAADYQQRLEVSRAEVNRVVAAHRSGVQRLSVPAKCPANIVDAVPRVDAGASERSTETRAELSEGAARFLTELAGRCDETAAQLTAAQAIMEQDRKLIQKFNAGVAQ